MLELQFLLSINVEQYKNVEAFSMKTDLPLLFFTSTTTGDAIFCYLILLS